MSTVQDHLRAMRARLDDLGRWTAGAMARDARSAMVMPASPEAVCWCIIGAYYVEVERYDPTDPEQADQRRYVSVSLLRALHSSAKRLYNDKEGLPNVNDVLGHRAVLAVLDDGILHPTTGERCAARHARGGRCVRDVHLDGKHLSAALEPGQRSESWRDADTVLLGDERFLLNNELKG